MKKNRIVVLIIAAIVIAGIGCAAGMMAKTAMASKAKVDMAEAKQIALSSVGVSADKATFIKEEFDEGVYEIDFYTDSNNYDFEIAADTGAIIDRETTARQVPVEPATVPASEQSAAPGNNDDSVIGVAAAKDIALAHAGVSSASFQEAYLDYDDGIRVYDIEFIADGKSYDYEINAITGAVLQFDVESMDYDDYYDD